MGFHSALYRGELVHARNDAAARRAFRYPVFMAALDLDELPALDESLWLFSHRGRNLFSFDERDYAETLAPNQRSRGITNRPSLADLREGLAALRAANGIPTPHTTRLVTNLRVAGYVFNPVSFFIDYDDVGALTSVIAEVNNTYGGRLRYVLGPRERITRGERVGFRHRRELFVSPFLHGDATYEFWFDAPLDGQDLTVDMHVSREDDQRVFTARFSGQRREMSDRTLAGAAVRYPFMTAQVIGLIHYEAVKMRLAGVPYRRPGTDHRPHAVP